MDRIVLLACSVLAMTADCRAQDGVLEALPTDELVTALVSLPERVGPAPRTPFEVPHVQFDQNAPVAMQEALLEAVQELPDIVMWRETPFSIPPAVGWVLPAAQRGGPDNAYSPEGEFGHSHRQEDGSMHLRLPAAIAQIVFEKGWGVLHPFSAVVTGEKEVNYIMVYGPRDKGELAAIWVVVQASYAFARGVDLDASTAIAQEAWGALKKAQ